MSLQMRMTDLIVEQLGVSREEVVASASFVDDLGADSSRYRGAGDVHGGGLQHRNSR